ncbi:MAG TPA: hypothetical protein VNC60_02855, partial [Actinomycetota bacterium]|nr:hypothetical protein [Actinomycetota bacterium]
MSEEPTVLGIDVGLSGTRAAVLSVSGRVMGRGRCAGEGRGDAGHQPQPQVWVDEVTKVARSALAEANARSVDAIGIGALGPVSVLLDEELNPLAVGPLFPADPAMEVQLLADRDPGALARAAWLVDACGYLVSTLVGRPVLDRISAADQSLPQDWHSVRIPQAQEPFAPAGGLTTEAASRLGLVRDTPVTVGTYDTFVDLAALGVERSGDRGLLLGSTLIVGTVCEGDEAPDGLCASRHAGDGWFIGGWTQSAGRSLAWWLGLFEPGRRAEMKRDARAMHP